jgi:hypothetical protein
MSKALFEAAAAGDLSKVETLLSHGVGIDWQHRGTGRTAIAEAALSGHTAVVRLLASKGADVNMPDNAMGYSPLAWASQQGHVEVVDVLMEYGADIDMVSLPYRFTPLMLAAMGGHDAVVARLLAAGAHIHAATVEGRRNALTLAQAAGHPAVAARLTAAGALPPIPPPEPTALAWPVIDIEGAPDRSSPDRVLRRFILLMTRWEEATPQHRNTLGDQGSSVITTEMNQIFAECCTLKIRPQGRRGSFGKPTAYDLEEELIASNMVSARRAEVVTRKASTHPLRHDSLFVVMKTKDGWRIDSKKVRYVGLPDWRNDIL